MRPAKAAALAVGVLLVLFLISVLVVSTAQRSVADLPVYSTVPEFSLTERSGEELTRDDLLGNYWIVDFIFTSCPDVCPMMSARMQELYEAFRGSDDVRFLSISVDPERDTLEVLDDYADSLGVDDERWLFARGPIEDVVALSEKGFLLAAANLPMGHSTRFALVDRAGQIRGYYDSRDEASLKTLKNELRGLLRGEG